MNDYFGLSALGASPVPEEELNVLGTQPTGDATIDPVATPKAKESLISRMGALFSGGTGMASSFTPPSEGARPGPDAKDIKPITLETLGLKSPGQAYFEEALKKSKQEPTVAPGVPTVSEPIAVQPEATFTLPSGEVRTIMPGQDIASAFGREGGTRTFQVDGGEVTVPSELAVQTMGIDEDIAARQAQQEFLASPESRAMTNRMLQSALGDTYARESAAREARLAAREARLAARPDSTEARPVESRRRAQETGIPTDSELRRIAKGQARGASPSDVADAAKIAARYGIDPLTGKRPEVPTEIEQQTAQASLDLLNKRIEEYGKKDPTRYEQAKAEAADMGLTGDAYTTYIYGRMGVPVDDGDTPITTGGESPAPTFTEAQESIIKKVMDSNPNSSREEVIKALQDANRL